MLRLANRTASQVSLSTLSAVSHRPFLALPLSRSLSSTPQSPHSSPSHSHKDDNDRRRMRHQRRSGRAFWLVVIIAGCTTYVYQKTQKSKDDESPSIKPKKQLDSEANAINSQEKPHKESKHEAEKNEKPQPASNSPAPAPAPVAAAVAAAPVIAPAATSPTPSVQTPTEPATSPEIPAAAETQHQHDIDWRKTPVDFPPDEEQAFSAAISTEKMSEHISPMVAMEIADKIYRRDENVLLQIYAPWCGACKMLTPVVQTVSKVLHEIEQEPTAEGQKPVQHISVYAMDGDANNLPGFLTKEESRALPLVKFFPKCGSQKEQDATVRNSAACQPQLYEFKPNTKNILEFVLAGLNAQPNLEQTNRKVEVDKALTIAAKLEDETQAKVLKALEARFAADSDSTPSLKVHEIAPCGDKLHRIMQNFMLSSYRSPGFLRSEKEEDERGLEMFGEYRTCTEKEEKKLEEFWQQVQKQAEDALEGIENKRKQAAEAGGDEKKTDNASETPANKETQKQN